MIARSACVAGALLVALALAGCHAQKEVHPFVVLVSALTDDGEPVSGVAVSGNGRELGATSENGGLQISLTAYDGKVIRLVSQCPEGFRTRGGETELKLQSFATGDPGATNELYVTVHCLPAVRRAAVLIRSDHPNLPVLKSGVELARTDQSGLAHIMMETRPHADFQLTLDTSQLPRLRPRNPSATFTMGDRDQMFVFDPSFEELPAMRKKRRRKPKPPTGPIEYKSVDSGVKPWHRRTRRGR